MGSGASHTSAASTRAPSTALVMPRVPSVPGCLEDALEALRKDHEFLLKGDVFTEDLIETWIDYKYDRDVNPMRLRPHPWEFALYYDC